MPEKITPTQIIATHKNTDFDALASMIAASLLYPGATPVLSKIVNPNVKAFLSIHKDMFEIPFVDEIDLETVTQLVVVDINRWDRLEGMDSLRRKAALEIILWDHHPGMGDIQADWACREVMGANITLMIRALKAQRKMLTPMQATLFLTGLYEDTGGLMFRSSTAEDAYAAGYLLDHKADLGIVRNFLRPAYGEKQKKMLFKMLQTAERRKIKGFSISFNRQALTGHVNNLSVVVRMYMDIVNVDAAFGIFSSSKQKKCVVIGRSTIEDINIGSIMHAMGGGGHPGAGAAVIASVTPEAVEEWLCEFIAGNQQSSVQVSDLMSFPVFSISPTVSMREAAALLREKGCTGVPVVDNDKVVGILSRRDFKRIGKSSQLKAPVKAFMSTHVMSIAPGSSPMTAARLMVKHDIGRLPVIEDDKIIGIITRSDSMLYFYDILPD